MPDHVSDHTRSAGGHGAGAAGRAGGRSLWCGLAVGAAAMAAADTVVFHQLLGWHHFYDRSTTSIGLLSDGLLQSAYLVVLVGGLFVLADLRRDRALDRGAWRAGLVTGAGAFQLFDGIVDHKLLRVHQIRYGVADLTPYDVAWNATALALLALGLVLVARSAHERPGPNLEPDG